MKFIFATIFTLALAMGVQSSILPLPLALGLRTEIAGNGLSYTATSGPTGAILAAPGVLGVHAPGAISLTQGPALLGAHGATIVAAQAPGAISLTQGPAILGAHGATIVAAHAPAAAVIAAPALGGSYVAQTRGAVHTAPLAGHIQSVANLNVAPAPGTL